MVACGDFFQLPPVTGASLFTSVLHEYALDHPADTSDGPKLTRYAVGTPGEVGTRLFKGFRMRPLTEQVRCATDARHTRIIERMRDIDAAGPPVSAETIAHLRVLKREDVEGDPGWATAPIVVTSNDERSALNAAQAVRYGRAVNEPVIRWRLRPTDGSLNQLTSQEADVLYKENPEMMFVFVRGGPAFVTDNIGKSYGIANGTKAVFHSLTFSPEAPPALVKEAMDMIAAARGGDVIDLPVIPRSVNVELVREAEEEAAFPWPAACTLVPGKVVVPILTSGRKRKKVDLYGTYNRTVYVKRHQVDAGFAITFHKVQGQTMDKVIVDINKRCFKPHLCYTAFYVAISRVKQGADLRVLAPQPGTGHFHHLKDLVPPRELVAWMQGFDRVSGVWSAAKAKEAYLRHNGVAPPKKRALSAGPAPAPRRQRKQ